MVPDSFVVPKKREFGNLLAPPRGMRRQNVLIQGQRRLLGRAFCNSDNCDERVFEKPCELDMPQSIHIGFDADGSHF